VSSPTSHESCRARAYLLIVRVFGGAVKLIGLCLVAGVVVAGVLFPPVGALGVMSDRTSQAVDAVSGDLADIPMPAVTTITDDAGAPIAYLYDQYRIPVPAEQISATMKAAIVAIEDHRFFQHGAVDPKGTLRALFHTSSGDVQGASTLTQQYVKNYQIYVIDRNDELGQEEAQENTIARKVREARVAVQLEQRMTREQILTGYLNLVPFSARVEGVAAAARVFFGTTPDRLSVPQAALLAGVVNNPIAYDPWKHPDAALQRRDTVIQAMVDYAGLSKKDGDAAMRAPLGVLPQLQLPPSTCLGAGGEYGFFCDYVVRYLERAGFTPDQLATGGYTIRTTLDPRVTGIAKRAVEANVPKTEPGVANTLAVVVPGTSGHRVVALVANRDYGTDAAAGQTTFDLPAAVSDQFGAGSIYKIFTAAAAMEQGAVGINTVLDNPPSYASTRYVGGPASCPRAGRYDHAYCVSNDGTYAPQLTVQQALATSPNTAFVKLVDQIGMPAVLDMAQRLGMRETLGTNEVGGDPTSAADRASRNPLLDQSQTEYFQAHPSFTLGPSPLSPLEVANVAATLESGGTWCPPTPIAQVTDHNGNPVRINEQPCQQVISPALADSLVTGLSLDDQVPGGTSKAAADAAGWTRPLLAKTGTTQNNESVGFLGATPQYAASSLVFADGTRPSQICATSPPHLASEGGCHGAFGGTVAAPPWYAAMTEILAGQPVLGLPPVDPSFLAAGGHDPATPAVLGHDVGTATAALQRAGYGVAVEQVVSGQPTRTVLGASPLGNVPRGATVTLYVGAG
jgi:membrane peptidoglycan carboxypeptidase